MQGLLFCMLSGLCMLHVATARWGTFVELESLLHSSGVGPYVDTWATSTSEFAGSNALPPREPVADRHPVLLIPPYAGVQLDLKITFRPKVRHWYCPHSTITWIFAWVNPLLLLPGEFGCYADAMRLELDPHDLPISPQGVAVRPRPGFNSAMQLLADDPSNRSAVMKFLAEALEKLGWQREVDLQAHLYDWRLSPLGYEAPGGSYESLAAEIEALHSASGKPVVVISYSMGSTYFNLFLNKHTSKEWRDKHLKGFISVSGAWAGSPKAVVGVLSGKWDHLEDLLNVQTMKYLARGTPSISWLMPYQDLFGNATIVTNTAWKETFAAADLPRALRLAGAGEAARVLSRLNDRESHSLAPPQLPLYCFYGTGVPTTASITYTTKDFSDESPTEEAGDGDGTVPVSSLSVCDAWRGQQAPPVTSRAFPGRGHTEMFRDVEVLDAVVQAVLQLGRGPVGAAV